MTSRSGFLEHPEDHISWREVLESMLRSVSEEDGGDGTILVGFIGGDEVGIGEVTTRNNNCLDHTMEGDVGGMIAVGSGGRDCMGFMEGRIKALRDGTAEGFIPGLELEGDEAKYAYAAARAVLHSMATDGSSGGVCRIVISDGTAVKEIIVKDEAGDVKVIGYNVS